MSMIWAGAVEIALAWTVILGVKIASNLSYLNWTYILCSIAISVLVILLLNQTKQKSNKG